MIKLTKRENSYCIQVGKIHVHIWSCGHFASSDYHSGEESNCLHAEWEQVEGKF